MHFASNQFNSDIVIFGAFPTNNTVPPFERTKIIFFPFFYSKRIVKLYAIEMKTASTKCHSKNVVMQIDNCHYTVGGIHVRIEIFRFIFLFFFLLFFGSAHNTWMVYNSLLFESRFNYDTLWFCCMCRPKTVSHCWFIPIFRCSHYTHTHTHTIYVNNYRFSMLHSTNVKSFSGSGVAIIFMDTEYVRSLDEEDEKESWKK